MIDAIVVGAGPAGSCMSSLLARRGWKVLLLEKHAMPRDKLCGEFLSPEVADSCARLGILTRMRTAGARRISRLLCASARGIRAEIPLPRPALGLTRFTFDHLLVEHARSAGTEVIEGKSVRRISGSLQEGFQIETEDAELHARIVVGAYGRSSPLDRTLVRDTSNGRSDVVAFKSHFQGPIRDRGIELYGIPGGYCGILEEEEGRLNVCWIGPSAALREAGGTPEAMFEWMCDRNPRLKQRSRELQPSEPFLAVASLSFRARGSFASDVCMIGDAAGMIAPLCGDGIGMAMRSAEIGASLAHAFLKRRMDGPTFKASYRKAWAREFGIRMRIGRVLQSSLTRPWFGDLAARTVRIVPRLAVPLIHATRG